VRTAFQVQELRHVLKLLELPVEGNRYEMLQRFQDYQDERRSKVRRVAAAEAVVDG
jgi:hypothetical protein